jgi:hypothetical protein
VEDDISGGRRHFWWKTTFPVEDYIFGRKQHFFVADFGPTNFQQMGLAKTPINMAK